MPPPPKRHADTATCTSRAPAPSPEVVTGAGFFSPSPPPPSCCPSVLHSDSPPGHKSAHTITHPTALRFSYPQDLGRGGGTFPLSGQRGGKSHSELFSIWVFLHAMHCVHGQQSGIEVAAPRLPFEISPGTVLLPPPDLPARTVEEKTLHLLCSVLDRAGSDSPVSLQHIPPTPHVFLPTPIPGRAGAVFVGNKNSLCEPLQLFDSQFCRPLAESHVIGLHNAQRDGIF